MTLIANIVGARPQFIKAGPVSKALLHAGFDELLVHTGQHYDPLLSNNIMKDVGLRGPDVNLGVGSGSHGTQTARMLEAIERVLIDHPVNLVITYGDTNSTIAAALAATKLGIPTAHVEAGLRSFNRRMPEELNRIVTDHLCDFLLAPTHNAMNQLAREGLGERAIHTGDVMVDALRSLDLSSIALPAWSQGHFYVATIHRAENTDDHERLREIISSLSKVDAPVHLLAHPRLKSRLDEGTIRPFGSLTIREPVPYAQMLAIVNASKGVFTDSGGLQKEAYILEIPCVTIRPETEWPETLEGAWNVLAEPDDDLSDKMRRKPTPLQLSPFGEGKAAKLIVDALMERLTMEMA